MPKIRSSPPKNRNIWLVCGIGDANLCHSERNNYMRGTLPVSSIGGGASGGSSAFGRLAAKTSQLAGKGTTFLWRLRWWSFGRRLGRYSTTATLGSW